MSYMVRLRRVTYEEFVLVYADSDASNAVEAMDKATELMGSGDYEEDFVTSHTGTWAIHSVTKTK